MSKLYRMQFSDSESDERKSNTCTEPRRSIQNLQSAALVAIGVTFAMYGAVAQAQQPAKKIPRVRILSLTPATVQKDRVEAFREALRKLGYIDGQNINVEYRYGDNKPDRMPGLAAELVHLNVDVIVTTGSSAARPAKAKEASAAIPIVMMSDNDPVGSGFVARLARPGGNITGLTNISRDLGDKRLELQIVELGQPEPERGSCVSWNESSQTGLLAINQDAIA